VNMWNPNLTLCVVNGKVRCKYYMTIPMCGVDSIHSLKLCRAQITMKCIQTSEIDK